MEYGKMLDRAYMSLPKKTVTGERFEIPDVDSHIQGTKTIVKNFSQILKAANREEKHLLKFLTSELAAPITISEGKLLVSGKFSKEQLNKIFGYYFKQFVLCNQCHKPDTHFIEMQGVKMLKCSACGASYPVKRL
ncbi:MAG TPA: translation initiation factor IF-2 subunit beta [Candidatus Diapherotrites archaeon]|uniref:Translation initiation factor 2 subunit beta n=1 Tax=Candidatus Iainarchaeum sp. TaxID=3101447 RepID=A0A7J4IRZ4_9ARCH|nr:translation initiation factor IF-2 subunit beta [Candidatus Diapherotrites archaeon]